MCKKKSAHRQKRLLEALEARLDALTENLSIAQVAEKGIDMVKEIKELHAILRAMREGDAKVEGAHAPAPRVILMWGDSPQAGESPAQQGKDL